MLSLPLKDFCEDTASFLTPSLSKIWAEGQGRRDNNNRNLCFAPSADMGRGLSKPPQEGDASPKI